MAVHKQAIMNSVYPTVLNVDNIAYVLVYQLFSLLIVCGKLH